MSAATAPELVTPEAFLLTDAEPETPEWYQARREGITATDLPRILGVSKYGNALSVWLDKRGELVDEAGEAAHWGQLLEDPIGLEWARRNATGVVKVGPVANAADPWMRASLDRLVTQCPDEHGLDPWTCGLEIKTRSAFKTAEWSQEIPDDVLAQVAWGRRTTGLDHLHIAVLLGGQRLVAYRYDRDAQLEDYLIAQARPVWEAVQTGLPPQVEPDAEGILLGLLNQIHPDRTGAREVDPATAEKWLAAYADAHDLERQARRLKTQAKTALVGLLEDAEVGLIDRAPAYSYTRPAAAETVTSEALRGYAAEHPDSYAALVQAGLVTTTDPGPVFRVKPRKDDDS